MVKKTMKWRDPYDQEENERIGRECATVNSEPSLTAQSFAQDADINVLVRRFGIDKVSSQVIDPKLYGDFTQAPDLRSALEIMNEAQWQFMRLSPRIRSRFRNDPAALWEFVQDAENYEEGIALGLYEKPAPEPPRPVSVPVETPPGEAGKPPQGA